MWRVVLLLLFITPPIYGQIYFSDVAGTIGLDYEKLSKTLASGLSFCDFDGDGLDDVTLATEAGRLIEFYKNTGSTFQKLPALVDHTEEAKQLNWVDFDNDGDKDLYVATFGGVNRLYQQAGELIFTDITIDAGLPLDANFSYGACWGDYNRDGWLDLYYSDRKSSFYDPSNQNRLFKNQGDGTFLEVSWESNTADQGKMPFCSAFFDFNQDKWPDLYTANDKLTGNTLLLNNGNGFFLDVSALIGEEAQMNAMCVAVGDYNNDGWQDVYVSNTPAGNRLFQNLTNSRDKGLNGFQEIADEAGVGFYGNGWGSNFLDADNDGDLDLYVSGSIPGSEVISSTFFENKGDGNFLIPSAGFVGDTTSSFSNAIGDFNEDGFPDIAVQNEPPFKFQLWQNGGGDAHWLKVKLKGVLSNRDAVGARIEVFQEGHYQMRYRHCGIGFLAQNSDTEIIGIGANEKIDSLVITWPTGHIDRLFNIPADQKLEILEGSTTQGTIEVDPEIEILTVSAVEKMVNPSEIILRPNPVKNELNLRFKNYLFSHYLITDVSGQVHRKNKVFGKECKIDVSNFPPQLYFIRLWDKEGRQVVKKWIKH